MIRVAGNLNGNTLHLVFFSADSIQKELDVECPFNFGLDKLLTMIQDDEKRAKMGMEARERAVMQFDMDKIAEKWTEAFRFFRR